VKVRVDMDCETGIFAVHESIRVKVHVRLLRLRRRVFILISPAYAVRLSGRFGDAFVNHKCRVYGMYTSRLADGQTCDDLGLLLLVMESSQRETVADLDVETY
jgi:hypothetical protein